ncbi:hypothetical protein IKF23_03150 [Candidatus Saccharibacteria bacterium]|nr:hypothetical protein [Candidatus Saccharibacteria bacterium]
MQIIYKNKEDKFYSRRVLSHLFLPHLAGSAGVPSRCATRLCFFFLSAILYVFLLFSSQTPTSATNIPTSVTIRPSLGLTLSSSSVVLNLDPTTNPFDNETVNIVVGTNNPTGYWVTMSSNNNDTSLINTNDTTKTIPTLESNISEADFPANHWGYKVSSNSGTGDSNTNYLPYVSGATIASNNTKVNNDTTNLTIGSKIDYLSVPGLYKQTFNFTALPIMTTNYIQNLNPELCTEEPMVVVDNRDEQTYIVQRLKDNRCWMMTNLNLGAYDLTQDLTSENTNVQNTVTTSTFNGWRVSVGTKSYTSGEFIVLTASNTSDGLVNDSFSNAPYGTLYNFCAASAGTYCYPESEVSLPSRTEHDICPAGWRLPTGNNDGEYVGLYNLPEYNSSAKIRAPIKNGGANFARAGYFDSVPTWQSIDGRYWSASLKPYNDLMMSSYRFNDGNIYPTGGDERYRGDSIRCILQE